MIVDFDALLDIDIRVTHPEFVPQNFEIHIRTYIDAMFESEEEPITFTLSEKVTASSRGGDPAIEHAIKQAAENLWKTLKTAEDTNRLTVTLYGISGYPIGHSVYSPEMIMRHDFPPQKRDNSTNRLYHLFLKWVEIFKGRQEPEII